jgi:hypothetical protein
MRVGVGFAPRARDAMSEPRNVRNLIAEAERAATAGDFVSAEELLRAAARLQESELGPLHPDLANTLNNLAIVAEKSGRPDDAERFYRRAVAIASASLPADDPMVVASRQNLEDFCHARGLPIDRPDVAPAPVAAPPSPPVSRRVSPARATLAIAVVALATAALFIARPWTPRQSPTAVPASAPTPAPAAEPARPAPEAPAPIDRTPTPEVDRAPAPANAAIALVTVQLCRNFSTRDWRCDPAGDSVVPGPLVFFTRVRSPRDAIIFHRWYQGDTLRQSVQLAIGANATEGYRTYSRQTVDRGDWRVEVRSARGDLLHEQRIAVR